MKTLKIIGLLLLGLMLSCKVGPTITPAPHQELEFLTADLSISSSSTSNVAFIFKVKAKKDIILYDVTASLSLVKNKTTSKNKKYSSSHRRKRTTKRVYEELSIIDLLSDGIVIKAGETKEFPASIEWSSLTRSHFICISGFVVDACKNLQEVNKCIEEKQNEVDQNLDKHEIYVSQVFIK